MRVVVVGATGNVGTSVVTALQAAPEVSSIVGVARRLPEAGDSSIDWVSADIVSADLRPVFCDADAVIHLAWAIQPARDRHRTYQTNVIGSRRVFRAAAEAGVPALVHASSVAAYSPGPKDRRVDEQWETHGCDLSFYSRDKAEAELELDRFEREHPDVRTVRMRPGLIVKREAAAEIRRLFLGPFLPGSLVRPSLIPVLPLPRGLALQMLHTDDAAQAYVAAVVGDAHGAFNLAAEPVLDASTLGQVFGARVLPVPKRPVRTLLDAAYRLHLQPSEPGWLDMGMAVPTMETARARELLGWEPRHSATAALEDLVQGLNDNAGAETPPLRPGAGGPLRIGELLTGVGSRL
jgi:nucleoside-diphosphate-sugar epimerase